jgi:hypothetical protein
MDINQLIKFLIHLKCWMPEQYSSVRQEIDDVIRQLKGGK